MTQPANHRNQETLSTRRRLAAYALARLKEPSTWRGLVLLITASGVAISPAGTEAIIATGIGIAGLLATVLPDSTLPDK